MEILVRNVHSALPEIVDVIERLGKQRPSRDGDVLSLPGLTTIEYSHPWERVLFWKERDANPFFHLFESLYFLAGRKDTKYLTQFVKGMQRFSDDGKNFHASYGHRWRKDFGFDQIEKVIEGLKENKESRREYLGIWNPKKDLGRKGKDLPCNVGISFQINLEGKLDMIVHNRSNDAVLGATGANAVHMSVLQEYIAQGVGVPMGTYWQVSSNMHIYTRDLEKVSILSIYSKDPWRQKQRMCPYGSGEVERTPVVDSPIKEWMEDLKMFLKDPTKVGIRSKFFHRVATPMFMAHKAHKEKKDEYAIEIIETQMPNGSDWKKASLEWLERRNK